MVHRPTSYHKAYTFKNKFTSKGDENIDPCLKKAELKEDELYIGMLTSNHYDGMH